MELPFKLLPNDESNVDVFTFDDEVDGDKDDEE